MVHVMMDKLPNRCPTRVGQVVLTHSDEPKVRSMLAAFDVLELLMAARNVGMVRPSQLAAAIKRHLDAYVLYELPTPQPYQHMQRALLVVSSSIMSAIHSMSAATTW